jgi:FkbM family methyltransferase
MGMAKALQYMELPNGLVIAHRDATEARFLYQEIFEDDMYDQYGIEFPDGGCYLDVGANIGLFSVFLTRKCQPAAIHAFEPIPATFAVLSQNANRHFATCARLHNFGIAAESKVAEFRYTPAASSGATMYPEESPEFQQANIKFVVHLLDQSRVMRYIPRGLKPLVARVVVWFVNTTAQRVKCQLRNLDDVIDEEGISQIDLLKIDAEGCETEILETMKPRTWQMTRQLIVEVHDGEQPLQRVRKLVEDHGFQTKVEPNPWFPHHLLYAVRPNGAESSSA